ncbi:MAG TPA: DUF4133 domain-containing protein [Draconibacterium sp.]|nr:DUF4133 domain-containing protein [Draconibacterium sp.]
MKTYTIQKIDTNLYIKGFSGQLVYLALYGILTALILFVVLYIAVGTFVSVVVCVPAFFAWLYRLNRIQRNYGHRGWHKKRIARQLPEFITIKQRICQH